MSAPPKCLPEEGLLCKGLAELEPEPKGGRYPLQYLPLKSFKTGKRTVDLLILHLPRPQKPRSFNFCPACGADIRQGFRATDRPEI